jgi:putative membrane protein
MKKNLRGIRIFLLVFFLAGALGLSLEPVKGYFIPLVPYTLLLSYILLGFFHEGRPGLRQLLLFALVATAGFLLEAVGVHTGLIFGGYAYGETLGLKAWGVPLLIGGNWLMLVYCTHLVIKDLRIHPLAGIPLGATLMTLYDLLMEPVAVALDMWRWAYDLIPVQNYIAWFIISLAFLTLFHFGKLNYRNPLAKDMLVIQAGFFGLLNLLMLLLG